MDKIKIVYGIDDVFSITTIEISESNVLDALGLIKQWDKDYIQLLDTLKTFGSVTHHDEEESRKLYQNLDTLFLEEDARHFDTKLIESILSQLTKREVTVSFYW